MGPEPPAPEATREISANPVRNGGGGCVGGQGRSQYEANASSFSWATNFCTFVPR